MSTPEMIFKNALNVYSHILGSGVRVSGNHQLPPGQKIIAVNHTVGSDPLFLPLGLDENPHILFQDGLFKIPIFGWFLQQCEQIPVERNSENAKKAFYTACELLHEGKTVALFPEGQLVPFGERVHAKTGVIRMALATGAPIIPLGIYVAEKDVLRIKGKLNGEERSMLWQVSGKCHLRFGAAWKPNPNQPNLHLQVDELMDRIYSLVAEAERESLCVSYTLLNLIPR
jgi:1-acyl-sn-glycerol-3-phosphate acyltransferase